MVTHHDTDPVISLSNKVYGNPDDNDLENWIASSEAARAELWAFVVFLIMFMYYYVYFCVLFRW